MHCVHQTSICRRHRLEKKRKRERERVFYISSRTQYYLDSRANVLYPRKKEKRNGRSSGDSNHVPSHSVDTHAHTHAHTKKMTEKTNSEPFIIALYLYDALSLVRF